jgi:hypothetical protein
LLVTQCTRAGEVVAGVDAAGAEPIQHRPVQKAEQLATVDVDLRPAITVGQPRRLLPDELTTLRVELIFSHRDTYTIEIVEQTQFGQFAHRMGLQGDANPQFLDGRCGLVDVHVMDAGVMQGQGQGHATDASSYDRNSHISSSLSTTGRRCMGGTLSIGEWEKGVEPLV